MTNETQNNPERIGKKYSGDHLFLIKANHAYTSTDGPCIYSVFAENVPHAIEIYARYKSQDSRDPQYEYERHKKDIISIETIVAHVILGEPKNG